MSNIVVDIDDRSFQQKAKDIQQKLAELEKGNTISLSAEINEKSLTDIATKIQAIADKAKSITFDADFSKSSAVISNISLKDGALDEIVKNITDAIEKTPMKPKIDTTHIRNEVQNAIKEAIKNGSLDLSKEVQNAMTKGGRSIKIQLDKTDLANQITSALSKKGVIKIGDITADRQRLIDSITKALAGHTFQINIGISQAQAKAALAQALAGAQVSVQSASGAAQNLSTHIGNAAKRGRALSDQMKTTTQVATLLGNTFGNLFASYAIKSFLEDIVKIGGELEKQKLAMESIMGDSYKAQETYAKVARLSMISPFDVGDLLKYTKQLNAFGIKYNELYDTTKRLSDIAAAVGVNFGRIAYEFGQTSARGWLDGRELRMFANSGIPLLQKLADHYSKLRNEIVTTAQVREMVTNRQVSFEDVRSVLWQMTDEGGEFYQMQEVMAESLAAKWRNLGNAWDLMLGRMAEGTSGGILKSIAEVLTGIVEHFEKLLTAIITIAPLYGMLKLASYGAAIAIETETAAVEANTLANIKNVGTLNAMTIGFKKICASIGNVIFSWWSVAFAAAAAIGYAIGHYREKAQEIERVNQSLRDRTNDGLKNLDSIKSKLDEIFGEDKVYDAKVSVKTNEAVSALTGIQSTTGGENVSVIDSIPAVDAVSDAWEDATQSVEDYQREVEQMIEDENALLSTMSPTEIEQYYKSQLEWFRDAHRSELGYLQEEKERLKEEIADNKRAASEGYVDEDALETLKNELQGVIERIQEIQLAEGEIYKKIVDIENAQITPLEQQFNELASAAFSAEGAIENARNAIERLNEQKADSIEEFNNAFEDFGAGSSEAKQASQAVEDINNSIKEQEEIIRSCTATIEAYNAKKAEFDAYQSEQAAASAAALTTEEAESAGETAAEAFVEGVVASDSISAVADTLTSTGTEIVETIEESATDAIQEVTDATSEGISDVVFSISDATRSAISKLSAAQRKAIKDEMLGYLNDYDPDVNKTLNDVYKRDENGNYIYDEIEQLARLKAAYDETRAAYSQMSKMDGVLESANSSTGFMGMFETSIDKVKEFQDYYESRANNAKKSAEAEYSAMKQVIDVLSQEYPQLLEKVKDGEEERNMTLSEQIEWLLKNGEASNKMGVELRKISKSAGDAWHIASHRFMEMEGAALSSQKDIEKFAESVRSQMQSLGYDLSDNTTKKMLKIQLDAELNTRGITSDAARQLIFQEFIRRRMIVETEVLEGKEGSSDTDIQTAAKKAIEGMNMTPATDESKSLYAKIVRDIINGSPTRADLAAKLRDRYSKINTEQKSYQSGTQEYKDLEAEANALEAIANATQIRLDNVRGTGGGSKDAQLDKWKEQVKLYREAYQEYKKWFDLYHDVKKAIEKTKENPLYAGINNPQEIRQNLVGIADDIATNKGSNTARGKYEVDVRGIVAGFDYDKEKQDVQDFLSDITEAINAESKKWDIYKKMFDATGNRAESAKFAGIGTGKMPQAWDYQAIIMRQSFEKQFENVDFKSIIGDADIWGLTDAGAMSAFGNGEIYKQWKAIKDHIESVGIEYLGNAATLRKNTQTAQDAITAENARYEEERRLAIANGASDQQLSDIDQNHQNKVNELKDQLFQLEPVYQQVLEGTLGMTRQEIDRLYERCQALLELIDSTKEEVKDQNGKVTGYKYKKEDGSEGFINKKTYDNLYNNGTGGSKSGSTSSNWKNYGSKFKRTEQDKDGKTTEKFDLQNTIGQISSLMGSMQGLGGLFETLGLEDEAGSLGTIMNSLQAGMTIAEGYFSGDPSKMLEGAIQLVTTLAQIHDNKLNAAIEASKARVEDLKGAYEQVENILQSVGYSGTMALEKLAAAEERLIAQLKNAHVSLTDMERMAYKAYKTGGSSTFEALYGELDGLMQKYSSSMAEYEEWCKKAKAAGGIAAVLSGGDVGTLGVLATSMLPVATTMSLLETTWDTLQGKWSSDSGWNFLSGGMFGVVKSFFEGGKAKEAAEAAEAEIGRINEALGDLARLGIDQVSYLNATDLGKALMGQYSNLVQQRMELEEQLYDENAKKSSDKSTIEDYKDQIAELNTQISDYLENVANELYELDLTQWSKTIAEAIADAFREGASEVQAFEDAVNDMLENVANNIIALGVIQPYIDKLQKTIFGEDGKGGMMAIDDPNARMNKIVEYLSDFRDKNAESITDEVNQYLEAFKGMGLFDGNVSGTSKSIESMTSEQADILAAYLNGIRLDTNALRLMAEKFAYEDIEGIRDVIDAQLTQLGSIAAHTLRTATAAESIRESIEEMHDDMHGVVTGSKEFHTKLS